MQLLLLNYNPNERSPTRGDLIVRGRRRLGGDVVVDDEPTQQLSDASEILEGGLRLGVAVVDQQLIRSQPVINR